MILRLGEIYDFIIQQGIATDPRSRALTKKKLTETKREHRKLSRLQKTLFDPDSLKNPYADTRILYGDRAAEIKRVLVGIDIEVGEVLLADRLSQKGKKIDLIIAHHPEGKALAGLHDVMGLQADLLVQLGFKPEIAKDLMAKRIGEVARRLHSGNHTRSVDAAKLLNFPLLCCHTPSDNHVAKYLQRLMDAKKPRNLQEVVNLLLQEPEYQDAVVQKAGPKILLGKPKDKAGKILVDMTGGTEGSKEIFSRISQAGIDTLLCMHLSEEHFSRVKPEHINVIVAGHVASDNVGMNLLLDKLERKGRFEFLECSGFKRVRRA